MKKEALREKSAGRKIWDFLWNSDSIWSWLVDLIILWVIIKFVLFPLAALITASALPSVIIESGSMQHQANCGNTGAEKLGFDQWWGNHETTYSGYNISKSEFLNFKYYKGMNIGDIIFLNGRNKDELKPGDIIIYNAGEAKPIIHRIVQVYNQSGIVYYETYGDNNCGQFPFEKAVSQEQIIGKAAARVPWLGLVKIATVKFISFISSPFRS